jgi:predicted DCC family thiol-disulfide oxidoreductase YuxK
MVLLENILIYDGYCNLCGAIVRFVKRHDRRSLFEFVPQQSVRGRELIASAGLNPLDIGTVILVSKSVYYVRSDAALRVFRLLGGGWVLLYGFIIIPRFIRDGIYRLIARTRYRLFGRSTTCYVPH